MATLALSPSQQNGTHTMASFGNIVQTERGSVNVKDANRSSLDTYVIPSLFDKHKPTWTRPPSHWTSRCHPLVEHVSRQTDDYFLGHWPFPTDKARKTYLKAGFSRVTCLYFPLARDDRIQYACRLLTVLFLIDDLLEDMSLEEGRRYNEHLMPFMRGQLAPDRSKPVEYILYDLWQEMRVHDAVLADEILEPTFVFMRSQTDKSRLEMKGVGNYLAYRESDVGKALLSALMRFSMDLRMSSHEIDALQPIEQNCARHISVVNDIFSWEKEVRASNTGDSEGAVLCSAVRVLSEELAIGIEATKRVLWTAVREWELVHEQLTNTLLQNDATMRMKAYAKGLEFQMSGNEQWSSTTLRYHNVS
ncbi:isoprenoid synthase domain-containing protein [Phaeosphaeria sp. MPI-PUGE-AT-0046c]|nr:isoprenoid synthase domain-containing protein [Phaeosphaeria sp. MPI-PUGE-AT-0046c]